MDRPSLLARQRTIVHIDLDAFYVQCALKQRPDLRGKPLGIVQKYLIVTCSYEARRFGVGKLMATEQAVRLCPGLQMVDGSDLTFFRRCSNDIFRCLTNAYTAIAASAGIVQHEQMAPIERLVMEEFWIDCTAVVSAMQASGGPTGGLALSSPWPGHVHSVAGNTAAGSSSSAQAGTRGSSPCRCGCVDRLRIGASLAQQFRAALFSQLGFTSSAGISTCKMAAKLASGLHKPNDQTTVMPQDMGHMLADRPVGDLPGVGWSTRQRLEAMGIKIVRHLLLQSSLSIARETGLPEDQVRHLQTLAGGQDDSPVVPSGPPATVSAEDSFKACTVWDDGLARLREQTVELVGRLVEDAAEHQGRRPGTLRLTVRHLNSGRTSRQVRYPSEALVKADSSDASRARAVDVLMTTLQPMLRRLIVGGQTRSRSSSSLPRFHLTLLNVAATGFPSTDSSSHGQPPVPGQATMTSFLGAAGAGAGHPGAATVTATGAGGRASARGRQAGASYIQNDDGDDDGEIVIMEDDEEGEWDGAVGEHPASRSATAHALDGASGQHSCYQAGHHLQETGSQEDGMQWSMPLAQRDAPTPGPATSSYHGRSSTGTGTGRPSYGTTDMDVSVIPNVTDASMVMQQDGRYGHGDGMDEDEDEAPPTHPVVDADDQQLGRPTTAAGPITVPTAMHDGGRRLTGRGAMNSRQGVLDPAVLAALPEALRQAVLARFGQRTAGAAGAGYSKSRPELLQQADHG